MCEIDQPNRREWPFERSKSVKKLKNLKNLFGTKFVLLFRLLFLKTALIGNFKDNIFFNFAEIQWYQ